jgi:methyltransferase (TIGR00027 family)
MTAAVIAASLLLLADDPDLGHLIDRSSLPFIERAVREVSPALGQALDRIPWPVLRRLSFGVERAVSPGFVAHYALRKHAVRTNLLAAVAEGYDQVVLLGAGFDMLSMAIPKAADVYEVDHPTTQAAKRRALDGVRAPRPVTFVGADLAATRLRSILEGAHGFDPRRKTVFVAEGLLMYLERRVVADMLAEVRALGDARVVATLISPDPAGRPRLHSQRAVVDLCMRLLGEEFVWGERADQIEELFTSSGFRIDAILSTTAVAERQGGIPPRRLPRPTGEVIVVAKSRTSAVQSNDLLVTAPPG